MRNRVDIHLPWETSLVNSCKTYTRALVAAFVAVVMTAVPAWAAPTISFGADCQPTASPAPTPTPTPAPSASPAPPPNCFPLSAQPLRGVHAIVFSADAGNVDRLQFVQMQIVSEDPSIASPKNPIVRRDYPDVQSAPRSDSFSYNWDTNALTPLNGAYTVEVTAKGRVDDPVSVKTRKDIRVDNPPLTLAAPEVVASTPSGISIEWAEAPEKDVQVYRLYRARTNDDGDKPSLSEFEPRLDTIQTKSFDDVTIPGYYWYRVQVIRKSVVTPSTGIASALSGRSTPGFIPRPTPAPTEAGATPLPRATPKPLAKVITLNKPPPVPDAPFSTVLDYGSVDSQGDREAAGPVDSGVQADAGPDDSSRRRALPAAIGAFMVCAWAVLTRSRLLT